MPHGDLGEGYPEVKPGHPTTPHNLIVANPGFSGCRDRSGLRGHPTYGTLPLLFPRGWRTGLLSRQPHARIERGMGKRALVARRLREPMARAFAWIMIAAVIMCAGCGGGSTKKSAAPPIQVGPRPIVAKGGEFRTIIPRGYANYPSVAQFWATGPVEYGFSTGVIVVREPASREVDISTIERRLLRGFRPSTRRASHIQWLSVNGQQAFSVDYLVTATGTLAGKVTHVRQVLVKHGAWVFFIRDIALPAQYPASLSALDEVLRNWRWQ
jgi:hypothetical protein